MSMTLAELQPGVRRKLGGRVDQNANINIWLAQAVLELTQNYPFTELLVTGPTVQFTAGVNTYDRKFMTQGNDDWTDIKSWILFFSGNSGATWNLYGRMLPFVEQFANISGIPKYWALSDDSHVIVGWMPNANYFTYARYQRVNPFSSNTDGSLAPVNTDIVYMPNDWQEIIEYAAAIRAASELRAFDYVDRYYALLHGDDEYRTSGGTRGKPGLIFGRVSQTQRNITHSQRQLKPVVKRY